MLILLVTPPQVTKLAATAAVTRSKDVFYTFRRLDADGLFFIIFFPT